MGIMTFEKSPFQSRIKIFLDGADRASMLEMNQNPLVKGFTTNPSLMKKAGVKDYGAYCREILGLIGSKPISFEVFADDPAEMKRQGLKIAGWEKEVSGSQVYVKIPIMNSHGETTLPLIRELSRQGVKINITAVYSLRQTIDICEAVKGGAASIVSIFAGRIADTGRDPLPLMQASVEVCRSFDPSGKSIELLWASTREAWNIVQAEVIGCQIITSPADMIKKVSTFNRPVDELSLDTVKTFKKDSDAAGFQL
jgi:transaldolase